MNANSQTIADTDELLRLGFYQVAQAVKSARYEMFSHNRNDDLQELANQTHRVLELVRQEAARA